MDGAQHAFGHVAHRAVGLDLGEIDMHRGIALARREPEIDDRMARDLRVLPPAARRCSSSMRASRPVPVDVIVAACSRPAMRSCRVLVPVPTVKSTL